MNVYTNKLTSKVLYNYMFAVKYPSIDHFHRWFSLQLINKNKLFCFVVDMYYERKVNSIIDNN